MAGWGANNQGEAQAGLAGLVVSIILRFCGGTNLQPKPKSPTIDDPTNRSVAPFRSSSHSPKAKSILGGESHPLCKPLWLLLDCCLRCDAICRLWPALMARFCSVERRFGGFFSSRKNLCDQERKKTQLAQPHQHATRIAKLAISLLWPAPPQNLCSPSLLWAQMIKNTRATSGRMK